MRLLILAVLLLLISFGAVSAQSADAPAQPPAYEEDFVEEAIGNIAQIETAYARARNYFNSRSGTSEENVAAWEGLQELATTIRASEPPTATASAQQQILFATERCQNFVRISGFVVNEEELNNIFAQLYVTQLQEACIVQVNAAKLRMLDYASAHDVNLFSELSAPIVITYADEEADEEADDEEPQEDEAEEDE